MANPSTILNAKFIRDRPLKILIHGYIGHRDFAPNDNIRPAYFQNNEYNIISLDYHPLVLDGCYIEGVRNLRTVGNCTAQLIDYLVTNSIFSFDSIHVIGFSLGGQTAGIIATYLKSGKLKEITGLDPAKPLFIMADNLYKLDQNDAEFVQVIHTDVSSRGVLSPSGHCDFYPNSGIIQPGCESTSDPGSCNHNRAPEYFAESINSGIGFWGKRCAHWYLYMLGLCRFGQNQEAIMGAYTPKE